MPTARPIMKIMFSTKKERPKTCPSREAAPKATIMEATARIIGISAATRAPNTTISITIAMGTPNISPFASPSWATSFKVLTDGSLACNQDSKAGPGPRLFHDVYDFTDVVAGVVEFAGHGEGHDGGAAVFGY